MNNQNKVILEKCPSCDTLVDCGITNGRDYCWCMEPANIMPLPEKGSEEKCYCKKCLELKISEMTEPPETNSSK